MLNSWLFALAFVAALGAGVIGGVFFAFSAFVMGALARLPPAQGIAAMQSINIVAVTPLFMTALFGTAGLCLVLVIAALLDWQAPGARWVRRRWAALSRRRGGRDDGLQRAAQQCPRGR